MTKLLCVAISSLWLLSGCSTFLTKEGKAVGVISGEPSFDCKFITAVHASQSMGLTRSGELESAIDGLKNESAKKGGNAIVITGQRQWSQTPTGAEAFGNAFNCPRETSEAKNKCSGGNPDACAIYSDAAMKAGYSEIGVSYRKRACALGEGVSCQNIAQEEKEFTAVRAKCDKGDGLACQKFGEHVGRAGDDILAIVYLRKGCGLKVQSSCDRIMYIEEYDKKARTKRDEAFVKESLQNQRSGVAAQRALIDVQQQQQSQQQMQQSMQMIQQNFSPEQPRSPSATQANCETQPVTDVYGKVMSYRTVCH